MKPYLLFAFALIALPAYASGTETPETYRDPYSSGYSFRQQVREYDLNIRCVHPFLDNVQELADLRFRQKHARPLFASVGPEDMETSQTAEWFGTITPPTGLELDFTSMDRALIAQRIAYLEQIQPDKTYARQRQEPYRVVVLIAAALVVLFAIGFTRRP